MGVEFRGKHYIRRVKTGKRTVKAGEAAAIWDRQGRHKQVIGPALVRLWYSTIRFLDQHVAGADEYLRVQHKNGTVEHVSGPTNLFENPVYHLGISVEKAILLDDESNYLVVQREGKEGADAAQQVIVTGPCLFFPVPRDSVHCFAWGAAAADKEGGGVLAEKGRVVRLKESILRTVLCHAQSADDHAAEIGVAISAKLLGISEVLATPNPLAAIDSEVRRAVNAALANAKFAQEGESLQVVVQRAVLSEDLRTKLSRSLKEQAGCELDVVHLMSVTPSSGLERVLAREDALMKARMEAELADASLNAAAARQEREQQLQAQKQAHELRLLAERQEADHARGDVDALHVISVLKQMRYVGVDVTKYLTQAKELDQVQSMKHNGYGWW